MEETKVDKICDNLIPPHRLNDIVGLFRQTGNHHVYHLGEYDALKQEFGNIEFKSIQLNDEIESESTLIVTDPDLNLMLDYNLVKKFDKLQLENGFLIVIMRSLTKNNPPYDDGSLPFFAILRDKFILEDTKEIKVRGTRYDNQYAYDMKAYLLRRSDVKYQPFKPVIPTKLAVTLLSNSEDITVEEPFHQLPTSGYLKIHDEIIHYGGKHQNKIFTLERGRKETAIPAKHMKGSHVVQYFGDVKVRQMPVLLPKL